MRKYSSSIHACAASLSVMQGVRARGHQPLLHAVPRIDVRLSLAYRGRWDDTVPVPSVDMVMLMPMVVVVVVTVVVISR